MEDRQAGNMPIIGAAMAAMLINFLLFISESYANI
jgi:hypothetical protein